MPPGSSNQDRHVPHRGTGGGGGGVAFPQHPPAPMFGAAATTYARSPPTGTPSSYGRFIQKKGRVGSAVRSLSARPRMLPLLPLFALSHGGRRLPPLKLFGCCAGAVGNRGGHFLGVLVRVFL